MFAETSNPYEFKYLVTGISGEGIKQVYLPPVPEDESKIYFKKEQKWTCPVMEPELADQLAEWIAKSDPDSKEYDPVFVPSRVKEIIEWENWHWLITEEGMWFWNNGVPTYLTPFYTFYLTAWNTYFGRPEYRETDKEITYWVAWWEENPNMFGGVLNTIRRYGKSAMMGAWLVFRTIRNALQFSGMQGENDDKVFEFYNTHVLEPMKKLPGYFLPEYDDDGKNMSGVSFKKTQRRSERKREFLGSQIDYRPSNEQAYDQAPLHTYVGEELGKVLKANVHERWKFVKPCLARGIYIRGKHFGATTVEFMDAKGRGGKAYQKLFHESDIDNLQPNGRTVSGLCIAFLPGDCALEGYFDEWGHPIRDKAKEWILMERKSVEGNPKDLSDLIRKYPLYIYEIFFINTDRCEFNSTILQNRRQLLISSKVPTFDRYELYWEDNKRFTKLRIRHNPKGGWLKATWLPQDLEKMTNLVDQRYINGKKEFVPKNDGKFAIGLDPIEHGVTIEDKTMIGGEDFVAARRSRPVLLVKRKFDSSIDGLIDTQEEFEARAKPGIMIDGVWKLDPNGAPYDYKTNRYIMMMDTRPNDPNVLFERVLMICWWLGCSIHVESQKPAVISYFQDNNCGNFILKKYQPVSRGSYSTSAFSDDGTPASPLTIQDYTGAIATDVEYFGHTYPFVELVDDLLLFNPKKTTEYDYAVAMGFCELACKMRPKVKARDMIDLDQFLTPYR